MKKISRLTAALAAAAIIFSGCGKLEDSAGTAAAQTTDTAETTGISQTRAATEAETTLVSDVSESPVQTTAEISKAKGYEKYVGYTPTAEELDAVTKLAEEQYNAILAKDADTYYRTLDLKGLFGDGDYGKFEDYQIEYWDKGTTENNNDYIIFVDTCFSVLWDKAYIDDPSLMTDSGEEWRDGDEDEDEESEEQEKPYSPLHKASDSISADFFRTADPHDERLNGEELTGAYFFFDYHDKVQKDGSEYKPLSENAAVSDIQFFSSLKYGDGRYFEFSLTFKDGDDTITIPRVLGWVKTGGECGVELDFDGCWKIYSSDDSVELPEEDAEALVALGIEQYNAIITRDADAYVKTLNLAKLLEAKDKAELAEELLAGDDAYEYTLSEFFSVLYDHWYINTTVHEWDGTGDPAEYDKNINKAALDAADKIDSEFFRSTDSNADIERKELASNYFRSYDYLIKKYGDLRPVSREDIVLTEEPYAEADEDGNIYARISLGYNDGERKIFLGVVCGFIRNGGMGVYLCETIPETDDDEFV